MLVSLDEVAIASALNVEPNRLFWCPADEKLLWCFLDRSEKHFVSLTESLTSFPATEVQSWVGVQLGSIDVRVDPTSAHAVSGERFGELKAAGGELGLHVEISMMGHVRGSHVVVGKMATPPLVAFHFKRWSIGRMLDDEWRELVQFDSGKISIPLLATWSPEED